jgi:hypothetical protein
MYLAIRNWTTQRVAAGIHTRLDRRVAVSRALLAVQSALMASHGVHET